MHKQFFTLTDEHIKLLRHSYVDWWDCETGAPAIDPKRPYGDSGVENSMHEILTGEVIGCIHSKRDELTEEEISYYIKLHKVTKIALQVVLATGKFETGTYECDKYSINWRKVE